MKILVTGAAGRLGSAVCRTLAEADMEVVGLDCVRRDGLPVEMHVVDVLETLSLYPFVEGCDGVVHLANHLSERSRHPEQLVYRENVAMNMNAFHAAVDAGARHIIYSSSVQAFSGTRDGREDIGKPSCLPYLPVDGEAPALPGNVYGLSKQAGENQLRYFARVTPGLACTAIRFPYLATGRRRYHHHHHHEHRHLSRLDECFAYLHVEDGARLILAVLQQQEPGYHQIFAAAPDTFLDDPLPEIIEEFYPDVPLKVPAEEMESLADLAALEEQFGWKPQHTGMFEE